MSHCDPSLLDLITDLAHQRVTQDTLDNLASITYRLDSIVKKPTRRSTPMTNPTADEQVSASVDNLERIHTEIRDLVEQLKAENESGVVSASTLARLGAVVGQLDEEAPPVEATPTDVSPPAEPPADNPDNPQPQPNP